MSERLNRWLPLRTGEFGLAFILGFILFANYAAMGITKVVSVSGFLGEVKDHYILLVWTVDMILLIFTSGLQSLIVDRYDRVKLMAAVLIMFAVLYALLPFAFLSKIVPASISYTLIYLLNDQQWRFFPVVFWILVNDIYDPAAGRRVMPVIANFAFLGTIVGLGVAAFDSKLHLGTVKLLSLNALIFFVAFLIAQIGLRKIKIKISSQPQVSMKESLVEGWEFIKNVPAFAYLALGMLATGAVMTVLLFHAISNAKLDLGAGFQSFYAGYNLIIAIASILIQTISARIIERVSLKSSFLLQPFVMAGSMISNLFVPGFVSSAASHGVARATYDTVDLSARKAFQALVPNEKRGRVSMFIDSYLPSAGTIVGSLMTFTVITLGLKLGFSRNEYSRVYIIVGIILALIALLSAFKVRATYEQSMLSWQLKRRTRGASVLDKLDFGKKDK
jgi:AAA family ATP:ADP antiporter